MRATTKLHRNASDPYTVLFSSDNEANILSDPDEDSESFHPTRDSDTL